MDEFESDETCILCGDPIGTKDEYLCNSCDEVVNLTKEG